MIQYKGLERFNAYHQYLEDYKNLACFFEELKLYKKQTDEYKKARNICYKYLISIMANCNILGFDTTAEELLLDELFDRL